MLAAKPERVRAMVACAEGLGVPRGSGMFRCTLQAVAFLSEEKIAAKVESLKNMFRWFDAEIAIVVCKAPMVLRRSNESLQLKSDCLISELGLEPAYIAHNPMFILCSLEGRVRPRYYVVKFLKENGLLDRQRSYCSVVTVGEKRFVEEFIRPHKEAAPHLSEDYAAACRGEVPARLMLASTKTLPRRFVTVYAAGSGSGRRGRLVGTSVIARQKVVNLDKNRWWSGALDASNCVYARNFQEKGKEAWQILHVQWM